MPVALEADLEGERQLSRRLGIVAEGVKDFREPLEKISDQLLTVFDSNFAGRGSLFGGWAPRKKSYPHPLLELTGTMRGAFKKQVHSDFAELFNTAPYFVYHQSNRPRTTALPRRIMMMIDQERKVFIQKAFQAYIVNIVRSSNNGGV